MSGVLWFYWENQFVAFDHEMNNRIEEEYQKAIKLNPNLISTTKKIGKLTPDMPLNPGELIIKLKKRIWRMNVLKKRMIQEPLNDKIQVTQTKVSRAVWFISSFPPLSKKSFEPILDEKISNDLDECIEKCKSSNDPYERYSVRIDNDRNVILKKSTIYHKVHSFSPQKHPIKEILYRGSENIPSDESLKEISKNQTTIQNSRSEIQSKDNQIAQNKWLNLPLDIWNTIFGYLAISKPSSLAILCMTCKFFEKLMPDETFWKKMYLDTYLPEVSLTYQTPRQRGCKKWKQKFGFQFLIATNLQKHFGGFHFTEIVSAKSLAASNHKVTTLGITEIFGQNVFFHTNQSYTNSNGSYGKFVVFGPSQQQQQCRFYFAF